MLTWTEPVGLFRLNTQLEHELFGPLLKKVSDRLHPARTRSNSRHDRYVPSRRGGENTIKAFGPPFGVPTDQNNFGIGVQLEHLVEETVAGAIGKADKAPTNLVDQLQRAFFIPLVLCLQGFRPSSCKCCGRNN